MRPDAVPARGHHSDHQHHRRNDRQQMDRAPVSPQPVAMAMDPERADRDDGEQRHPDPAERPVWQRALGRDQLNDAEHECGHGRKSMQRDRGNGIKQRLERHGSPRLQETTSAHNRTNLSIVKIALPPALGQHTAPSRAKRAASNQLTARDAEIQDVLTADQNGMSSSMSLPRPPPPAGAATRRCGGALDGPLEPKSPPMSSPP